MQKINNIFKFVKTSYYRLRNIEKLENKIHDLSINYYEPRPSSILSNALFNKLKMTNIPPTNAHILVIK